jgi:hypothetical protein
MSYALRRGGNTNLDGGSRDEPRSKRRATASAQCGWGSLGGVVQTWVDSPRQLASDGGISRTSRSRSSAQVRQIVVRAL